MVTQESYSRKKFVYAKSTIFAKVCYIYPCVLYFPGVGQIFHGAVKYRNKCTL